MYYDNLNYKINIVNYLYILIYFIFIHLILDKMVLPFIGFSNILFLNSCKLVYSGVFVSVPLLVFRATSPFK